MSNTATRYGYDEKGRPTPFREYLERESEALHQEALGPPPRATRAETELLETPPGYRQPVRWDQLYPHPPEVVLLATPEGWRPIDRYETIEGERRVPVLNPTTGKPEWDETKRTAKTKVVPWRFVTAGRVWYHGARLDGLRLASIRIPDPGDGRKHG